MVNELVFEHLVSSPKRHKNIIEKASTRVAVVLMCSFCCNVVQSLPEEIALHFLFLFFDITSPITY